MNAHQHTQAHRSRTLLRMVVVYAGAGFNLNQADIFRQPPIFRHAFGQMEGSWSTWRKPWQTNGETFKWMTFFSKHSPIWLSLDHLTSSLKCLFSFLNLLLILIRSYIILSAPKPQQIATTSTSTQHPYLLKRKREPWPFTLLSDVLSHLNYNVDNCTPKHQTPTMMSPHNSSKEPSVLITPAIQRHSHTVWTLSAGRAHYRNQRFLGDCVHCQGYDTGSAENNQQMDKQTSCWKWMEIL